jgi:hypothetical protein
MMLGISLILRLARTPSRRALERTRRLELPVHMNECIRCRCLWRADKCSAVEALSGQGQGHRHLVFIPHEGVAWALPSLLRC